MVRALKSQLGIRIDAAAVSVALALMALIAPSPVVAGDAQNGFAAAARPQPTATPAHAASDTATTVVGLVRESVIAAFRLVYLATSAIWDVALWTSERMIGFLANSIVNPVSGNRLLFGGVPGVASQWATSVLALGLLAMLVVLLAGPLYMSWRMWRARHSHRLHYR
jgi:hypothetical protein